MQVIGSELAGTFASGRKRLFYRVFGHEHIGFRMRSMHVMKAIGPVLSRNPGATILEAGSANGTFSVHLARKHPGARVVGVELELSLVQYANETAQKLGLTNAQFFQGDLAVPGRWPVADLIVSVDVLEHIDDDVSALRNLHGGLKDGGTLVLHVPNLDQRYYVQRYGGQDTGGHSRHGYSESVLEAKLNAAGFEVVSRKRTCGSIGELALELYTAVRSNRLMLSFVFPFLLLIARLDGLGVNPGGKGNGLLFVARKSSSNGRAG